MSDRLKESKSTHNSINTMQNNTTKKNTKQPKNTPIELSQLKVARLRIQPETEGMQKLNLCLKGFQPQTKASNHKAHTHNSQRQPTI